MPPAMVWIGRSSAAASASFAWRDQLMNAERGLIPEFGPRSTFSGG